MSKISPKKKDLCIKTSVSSENLDKLKIKESSPTKKNSNNSPYGPTVKPLEVKLHHPKLDVVKVQLACSPYRVENYDRSMIEFSKILHKERFDYNKKQKDENIGTSKHNKSKSYLDESLDREYIAGALERDNEKINEMKSYYLKEFDKVMLFDIKYYTKYKQEPLQLPTRPHSAIRTLGSPINNTSKLPNLRRSSGVNTFNYFYSNRELDNFNNRPKSAVREYKWNIRI